MAWQEALDVGELKLNAKKIEVLVSWQKRQ